MKTSFITRQEETQARATILKEENILMCCASYTHNNLLELLVYAFCISRSSLNYRYCHKRRYMIESLSYTSWPRHCFSN